MRKVSFSTDVYASLQIVWQLLLDKIEKPQNYNSDIAEVKILERYDDGLLREFRTQGIVIKERVTINEARGEVRFFIVEHPLFFGQVINRLRFARSRCTLLLISFPILIKKMGKPFRISPCNIPARCNPAINAWRTGSGRELLFCRTSYAL